MDTRLEDLARPPSTIVTPRPAADAAAAEPYVAWGREHTHSTDIEVRRADGHWRQCRDPFIVAIDGETDRQIALLCTSFAVNIEGRNLGELRQRLRAREVDFVQEFDPARWPRPAPDAPFVESIQIIQARAPQVGPSRA